MGRTHIASALPPHGLLDSQRPRCAGDAERNRSCTGGNIHRRMRLIDPHMNRRAMFRAAEIVARQGVDVEAAARTRRVSSDAARQRRLPLAAAGGRASDDGTSHTSQQARMVRQFYR